MPKIIPAIPALVLATFAVVPAGADTQCLQIGRIWSFHPLDTKTLIVEDQLYRKFRVALAGYCPRLPFKLSLTIKSASGISGLDCVRRGDTVISQDVGMPYTCPVMSIFPLGQDIVSPTPSRR